MSRDSGVVFHRFGFLFLVKNVVGLCARMAPGCSNDKAFIKVACKVEVGSFCLKYGKQQPQVIHAPMF